VLKKRDGNKGKVVGFVGVGFDNTDGHKRLTQSEHFLLVGGSAETHGSMQETAIKFTEALRRRGKELQETPVEEVIDLFGESLQ
jgi:hypothetical protein